MVPRLPHLLRRSLWEEAPAFRRYRRRRFGLLAPVALFAGALWGKAVGGAGAMLAGAGLFGVGAYLYTRLYPALLQGAETRWGRGRLAAFLWDALVVGGGGLVVTRGMGLDWPPAVGSALVLGGGAALGLAWFLDEGGTRAIHALVSPLGRTGSTQAPFSHIEARLARGEHEAARSALVELVEQYPRDARGWTTLARLLAGPLGEPEGGLRTLEEGLRAVRGRRREEFALIQQIVRLRAERGDPLNAAPLVARYADRWGEGPEGDWARDTVDRLRARLRDPAT
jgi:hypothetical protein